MASEEDSQEIRGPEHFARAFAESQHRRQFSGKGEKTVKKAHEDDLKERLERLTHEVVQLKSLLVYRSQSRRPKANGAWRDLMKASEEISSLWSGYSAVEEIRAQRER